MHAGRPPPHQDGTEPAPVSALDRRILTGPDPFERRAAASAWEVRREADVESIHAAETRRLLELVEAVRADGRTRAVMVTGQPGFGKTHLLGRLKARLPMPALFVYVTAFADPERPYRHLLRQLVASLEQELVPESGRQLQAVLGELERIDPRRLVAQHPGIDLDAVRALRLLAHRRLWQGARTWLSGVDMDPEDVRALGLHHALATEEDVHAAIVTFARVLAAWGPVVVAWDQLESLAATPTEPGLAILGRCLMRLHDEAPNLLLVLACLESTSAQAAALWPQSVRDRLAAEVIGLKGLTPEQAQELCHLRMQALYGPEPPPWRAYPFRHEFFAELFRSGAAGPRRVLAECSEALRRLRVAGRVEPIVAPARTGEAGAPSPAELGQALREELARRTRQSLELRRRAEEEVSAASTGGVPAASRGAMRPPLTADGAQVARTLQRVLQALARSGRRAGGWRIAGAQVQPGPVRGQPPMVVVELERGGRPLRVGIGVLDTASGQSFARQMHALVQQLREGRFDRGLLVRERRVPVPSGWKQGHEYLRQWKALGGRFVEASDEAVAGLEGLWSLLAEAESGDVAPLGRPVKGDEALQSLVEEGEAERALDELLGTLKELADSAIEAPGPERAAGSGELPSPAAAPAELAFSVSEAVAALACPRYFVLSQGRRPPAAGAGVPEPRSFAFGTALHRLVAAFVAHLPSAAAGPVAVESDGSLAPFPREAAWVAVARRSFFEVWRKGEGRGVPEDEAERLWQAFEGAVRFLCRLLAASGRGGPGRRAWWLPGVRRRAPAVRAEVPLEAAVELGNGRLLHIRGVADVVVEEPGGRRTVVEFKTTPPPHAPLDLFQVALYAWMLTEPGHTPAGGGGRPSRRPVLRAVEPVLVYLTADGPVVRRFDGAQVAAAVDEKVRPFLSQLRQWARWRPGEPAPPVTRLPELCPACPYHPPCPEEFPVGVAAPEPEAGQAQAPGTAARSAGAGERPDGGEAPGGRTGGGEVQGPRPAPQDLPVHPARLEEVLRAFGCDVHVIDVQEGPSFVRYLLAPESRTSVERIRSRAEDLKVRLKLPQQPMVDSVPGAIAVDVARETPRPVPLRELLQQPLPARGDGPGRPDAPRGERGGCAVPLGVGIGGQVRLLDFSDPNTPHLLVAGTTGSGKSVLLLSMAASVGALYEPGRAYLLLVDPKQVTFGPLQGSPYLWRPPVLELGGILEALEGLVEEMQARYARLGQAGAQTVYHSDPPLAPPVVCIVDEFGTLVTASKKDREAFERRVLDLASKGRAAGIHLVLSTQRPDSTVVSGTIKENLPARIALRVTSRISSQVVLDRSGAETLAGKGDMLFVAGSDPPVRLQAPFTTPDEARRWLRVP